MSPQGHVTVIPATWEFLEDKAERPLLPLSSVWLRACLSYHWILSGRLSVSGIALCSPRDGGRVVTGFLRPLSTALGV